MRRWRSTSEAETRAIGRALAEELAPDGVLLLCGELGSGKTVLAKGVASGLGVDPDEVQSPTFILARHHHGSRGRLAHLDLYRLGADEVAQAGLLELLEEPGVKVVEWAERIGEPVAGSLRLRLRAAGEAIRVIEEVGCLPGEDRGDDHSRGE